MNRPFGSGRFRRVRSRRQRIAGAAVHVRLADLEPVCRDLLFRKEDNALLLVVVVPSIFPLGMFFSPFVLPGGFAFVAGPLVFFLPAFGAAGGLVEAPFLETPSFLGRKYEILVTLHTGDDFVLHCQYPWFLSD